MTIRIPSLSLVVLVGTSGSGKTTFARKHFRATEIVSSDVCRGMVSDDENDQTATPRAFALLQCIVEQRLATGRLTVVDATNVQPDARARLVELARKHHALVVAIVFDLPPKLAIERNATRPDRAFGPNVVLKQASDLRRSLRGLRREGFHQVEILDSVASVDGATLERTKLWCDRRDDHGPFDLIGDVHGCREELEALLAKLGYVRDGAGTFGHPDGRRVVFLGDLVDRGPDSPGVLRIAMDMVRAGAALCIPGNHEAKLLKKLHGRDVKLTHGLQQTMDQLDREPAELRTAIAEFVDRLVSHLVLDDGKLVVAHAGLTEELQGRASAAVRSFAMFGETTGETDEYGLPVRYDWAEAYRGSAMVVYGHTPVLDAEWVNRTLCIDTGCVFGGKLTALRYPERELVDVPASAVHYEPSRPLVERVPPTSAARPAGVLDIADVSGKRIVRTRTHGSVTIPAAESAAALEVMSRFAIDPRWLVYLPPTMSPAATSKREGYLEHPDEAFAYFAEQGVDEVICQEKHMGSRAVLVVCRDLDFASARFGERRRGVVYTRTGRAFFPDDAVEAAVLDRVADAIEASGLWDELTTSWICLDAELLPWSAKARELLKTQYVPVGTSGRAAMQRATAALEAAAATGVDASALLDRYRAREGAVARYETAFRRYCWPVRGIEGLSLAPFHVLASEGRVHSDRDHGWHVATIDRLVATDPAMFRSTRRVRVAPSDPASCAEGIAFWESLTAEGGEGMVVKPMTWDVRGRRGPVQPALKCRGREYLRIIYGPEYTLPEHLQRLRSRNLSAKRALAAREYALAMEGLARAAASEPLHRVHECVFGVLALESEAVDPRL